MDDRYHRRHHCTIRILYLHQQQLDLAFISDQYNEGNDFEDYQEVDSPSKSDTPQQTEQLMSLQERLNQWSEDNANQYSSEEDNRDQEEDTDPWSK